MPAHHADEPGATPARHEHTRPVATTEPPKRRMATWLRALIPAVLIVAWLGAMGMGGPIFGKISGITSNEQTAFLPTDAEATEVQNVLPDFLGDNEVPAIVVAASEAPLTAEQNATIQQIAADAADIPGVLRVSPVLPSDDGHAAELVVVLDSSESDGVKEAVGELRTVLADADLPGVETAVTGPAGFTADISHAFSGIDGILLLVALVAVLIILVIVYRSPLLPIIVLLTSMSALCLAILVVYELALAGVFTLSGQTQGILFILVVGAATDYSLLYVARFREALAAGLGRWDATKRAWRGSVEPILASGGTVIAGLLCLLLSQLASNQQLGPVAAIGIVAAILAGLTLLPALLLAFGRVAFWPAMPKPQLTNTEPTQARGLWAGVARFVARRPRPVWIITALALALGAVGLTQLQANGVPSSDFVVGESQARDGQALLSEHFPGGAGAPTYVLVDEDSLDAVADAAARVDGVDGVAVTSANAPGGALPIPAPPSPAFANASPTVIDGHVLVQVTLADAPDSDAAQATVRALRDAVHAEPGDALVGGRTAAQIDTNDAAIADRTLIIPIVLAVILLILMLLLRAVVAPILLIATTVLSFATALGVAAVVFQLMGIPDMDPSVPLFAFVFLVALGVDYNIFLMTRVREEVLRHGHREGVLRGLRVTGGVITSAGVVLAATFAALGVIPVLFLLQLAIIVAFGVLVDTVVVRSLLVPALALDVGPATWWPSALWRRSRGGQDAVASDGMASAAAVAPDPTPSA